MKQRTDVKKFMEKAAEYGSVLGLSSVKELMKRLGNPQDKLAVIHVVGTNGKGSVCCFLQNILIEAGYRTGMYTSPAVFAYEERFRVNECYIVPEEYEAYITEIAEVCKAMVKDGFPHPTVFEIETALAYLYFYRRGCDVAIMEAGMGGAGDATNVTSHPLCCVITSIGMDHMQFLGNSIEDIARNKAGILKEGCPAVSIWQEERVERVLTKEAADRKAPLVFCQPFDPSYPAAEDLQMLGSWQADNSALAVETAHCLRNQGLELSEEVIRRGIQKAFWPGRMEQVVWEDPAKGDLSFYLDGAHNIPAARRLAETLEQYFTNASITYIIGVLADKEYDGMLDILLPKADRVITLTPNNARALSGKILQDRIRAKGYEALFAGSVSEAVELAAAQKTDRILAFGSLSYLGELKSCLTRKK